LASACSLPYHLTKLLVIDVIAASLLMQFTKGMPQFLYEIDNRCEVIVNFHKLDYPAAYNDPIGYLSYLICRSGVDMPNPMQRGWLATFRTLATNSSKPEGRSSLVPVMPVTETIDIKLGN